MIEKSDVLVVVPALNEADTIAQVVRDVQLSGYKVVVVDDGSADDTALIARSNGANVVSLAFNLGVGGALRCGFRYAVENGYSAIIQCDADGQHLPQHLDDLLNAVNRTGADMIVGSRFNATNNTLEPNVARRIAMWLLARVAQRATKYPITDSTSGFRMITQPLLCELASSLPAYYLGDTFVALVIAGRAGYRVEEIAVAMAPRLNGRSSATPARAMVLIAKSLTTVLLGLHFRIQEKSTAR